MDNSVDTPEVMLCLIDSLRREENISVLQMTYGLCDGSQYTKVLKSVTRRFDKLLIDAFYERLGKNLRNFECMLDADEYGLYEKREEFRDSFFKGDTETAKKAARKYASLKICEKSAIHRQMAMLFEVMLMLKEKGDNRQILEKAIDAIRLTIPEFMINDLKDYLYSEVELILLDVMLKEKEIIEGQEKTLSFYEAVYELFRSDRYSDNEQIYRFAPMIYRYLKILLNKQDTDNVIKIADRMINGILDNNKIQYLAEFLECKGIAKANKMCGLFGDREVKQTILDKLPEYKQSKVIKEVFKKYYKEWTPDNDIQIYWEMLTVPSSKIVKQRRELLGLTQEDLTLFDNEIICSLDTVSRLEKGTHKINLSVERKIMRTLRLSSERFRREFVTGEYSEICTLRNIAAAIIKGDNEEWERLIKKLEKSNYSHYCFENEQFIRLSKLELTMFSETDHEFLMQKLRELLKLTLSEEQAEGDNIECYMFNTEFFIYSAIEKLYKIMEKKELFFNLNDILLRMYKQIGPFDNSFYYRIISVERSIASDLGNLGRFDESNEQAESSLIKCLKYNCLDYLCGFLYCLVWNDNKDSCKTFKNKQSELRAAYVLSDLVKREGLKQRCINQCRQYYTEDILDDISHA